MGAVIAWLIAKAKKKETESNLLLANQQLTQEQHLRQQAEAASAQKDEELDATQQALTQVRLDLERANTLLQSEQEQAEREKALLHEQNEAEKAALREQMANEAKMRQEQFQNLATRLLEQSTDRLKTQNAESIQTLTTPLRQHIEQLQQAIHNTNAETAKQTASLSEQLKSMAEQTTKINETATHLTNVMRGGNKIQGNWGEMTLKNLLESQGLVLGRDFDLQHTITDENGNPVLNEDSGSKMVPDAILHYPNNEDVIIDAKMSIDAYAKYVETEDEAQRKVLAKEVVRSVRDQFKKLSAKEYSRYVRSEEHTSEPQSR